MPTLITISGIRFFYYSNENNEPIHVHMVKGDASGKIWLEPLIEVAYMNGFSKAEERLILTTVELNVDEFKIKWNEHFSK